MQCHRIDNGLALVVLGLFAGVCNGQHAIQAVHKGYLGVADCRVWLIVKTGVSDEVQASWRVGESELRVNGGRWDGWYLAYDPSGKDPRVVLSRKPGAGTRWDFSTYKDEGFPHYGPIRATTGKVKGWYLDINDTLEKLADGDQAIAVHGLFLIESPRRIQKFDIYVGE